MKAIAATSTLLAQMQVKTDKTTVASQPQASGNTLQVVTTKSVSVSLSSQARAISSAATTAKIAAAATPVNASDIAGKSDADWKTFLSQNASFSVTGSASDLSSVMDRLQGAGAKVTTITLTGTDALTLTAAQLKADAKTLDKMTSSFSLNVTNADMATATSLIAKSPLAKGTIASIAISDKAAKIAAGLGKLDTVIAKIDKISQSDTTGLLSLSSAQMTSYSAVIAKFDASVKVNVTGVTFANMTDTLAKDHVSSVSLSMTSADVATNIAALKTGLAAGKISSIVLPTGNNALSLSANQVIDNAAVLAKLSGKYSLSLSSSTIAISQLSKLDANTLKLLPSTAKLTVTATPDEVKDNYIRISGLAKKIDKIVMEPGATISVGFADAKKYSSVLSLVKGGTVTVQLTGNYNQYKVVQGTGGSYTLIDGRAVAATAKESGTLTGVNFFKFANLTTYASSGDSNIDAVLNGGQNMWWHDGTGAAPSANVLSNKVTTLASGSSKTTLSYSFLTQATVDPSASASEKAMTEMSADQKEAVRDAFAYLSSLINVTFTESTDSGKADINFGMNVQGASAGYANPPHASGAHPSYLFLASNQPSNSNFDIGTYGWETLVHEIGHTMGLKHPFNGNAGGGGAPQPYLPTATNNHNFSIMSYTDASNVMDMNVTFNSTAGGGYSYSYSMSAVNPQTFMTYDIAALQFLYGQNTDEQSTTVTFDAAFKGLKTIYAPVSGAIDASATTKNNIFDLRGGGYSTIGYSMQDKLVSQLKSQGASDTLANSIAADLVKKNGSKFYSGLNTVGLAYGSHINDVTGGSAKDQFYVNGVDDVSIDGGAGADDIVYLAGKLTDWTVKSGQVALAAAGGSLSGDTVLTNGTETVTLKNVEKYAFFDAMTSSMTHTA